MRGWEQKKKGKKHKAKVKKKVEKNKMGGWGLIIEE